MWIRNHLKEVDNTEGRSLLPYAWTALSPATCSSTSKNKETKWLTREAQRQSHIPVWHEPQVLIKKKRSNFKPSVAAFAGGASLSELSDQIYKKCRDDKARMRTHQIPEPPPIWSSLVLKDCSRCSTERSDTSFRCCISISWWWVTSSIFCCPPFIISV